MDIENTSDFYNLCDPLHREFFSTLAWQWQESGHLSLLTGQGLSLRVCSSLAEEGQGLGLFELLPGRGTAPSTIALSVDNWRNWFGEAETSSYLAELKAIHGLEYKLRDSRFYIVNPGHMSGGTQQELRSLMLNMASRSHDLIAP